MKRKQPTPKKGAPAYMNTYGDMMTLLLTFFVLLFSMSSMDSAKFKAFINSYSGSSGILEGGEILMNNSGMLGNGVQNFPVTSSISQKNQELYQKTKELQGIEKTLEEFIYAEKLESKVGVELAGDTIVIRFADILLFESGKAELKAEAKEVLSAISGELKTYIQQGYRLSFNGHTDNIPIKNIQFPSNWELSAARAIAVAKFFIEEESFSPATISAEGFGEHMPIGDNTTEEGRSMNRRVEIKLAKDN
ncbi:MAG: OmpA/MotB family protein [Cellulosilyticaceae bacterium]